MCEICGILKSSLEYYTLRLNTTVFLTPVLTSTIGKRKKQFIVHHEPPLYLIIILYPLPH